MKIAKIKIDNILGIQHLEIEPGSVTLLEGANGTGKTSVLEAIRAAFGGGYDATLVRTGAEKGEVVLVLEDGTQVTKTIGAGKSDLAVKHPIYGNISKPATYVKQLADILSLNPVEFLTAPAKQRVDILLQAIPMKITADQLREVPVAALQGIDLDQHALPVIGKIARAIFDLRTGVNRAAKEKAATAKQMAETLPAEAPEGDWKDELERTAAEYKALQRATQKRIGEVKASYAETAESAKTGYLARKQAILQELDGAIERLRAEAEEAIRAEEAKRDQVLVRIAQHRDEELSKMEAEYRPLNSDLSEKLGRAKAMVEQHAKAESTRQFIAQLDQDAEKLEAESSKLTHALGRLEILKASLLERLPIEGLEVRDQEIYLGGLPFDRVNTSKRVRLAIEVAKLRAGSLGLVAVDGLECLDSKTFESFKREATKSNLQFVIAKVGEGPLTVSTEGEVA